MNSGEQLYKVPWLTGLTLDGEIPLIAGVVFEAIGTDLGFSDLSAPFEDIISQYLGPGIVLIIDWPRADMEKNKKRANRPERRTIRLGANKRASSLRCSRKRKVIYVF